MSEYIFQLPIGDWSNDGHGICDWFVVRSNKEVKFVFEAYFKSADANPDIDPANICSEYEDRDIDEETLQLIESAGFKFDGTVSTESFAKFVLWFIMLSDKDLKLEIVPIPKLINWELPKSLDDKYFPGFGYGLV